MLVDTSETYRTEFTIIGLDGLFTAFLAGMAVCTMKSATNCKMVIDSDYPVKIKPISSAYYGQMDFDDNSTGPILGYEDDDSDLRNNYS